MHMLFAFLLSFGHPQTTAHNTHPFVAPHQYEETVTVPSHKDILAGSYANTTCHSCLTMNATSAARLN